MADSFIQVPVDGLGKKVDAASLDVGTNSVIRQRIVLGDNSATAQFATVTGGALNVNVANAIALSGTAVVAFATPITVNNISATVTVQGNVNISTMPSVVLAAGASNVGTINNISATVTVQGTLNISATVSVVNAAGTALMGAVSLAAGTANIGFINNISAPVQLAAGTANIGTINNISAAIVLTTGTSHIGTVNVSAPVALAAGAANIGFLNDISATLDVLLAAGTSNIGGVSLVAGTANIGFINGISATVNVAFAGGISLAAGTANIGFLNGISATVTVQGNVAISATVVTGLSYVIEKTTNSQVQVGDSANAAIRVSIVSGAVGGSGGTSQTDGVSFDAQVSAFTPIGGVFDDVASGTLSENDCGVVRMTTNRAIHANIRTDGGVKMDDSTNAALRVNVVAGSAGGPSSNDNTTYSTGATAIAPAGFIHFSASSTTMTEGRVGAARITAERGLHINLRANDGTEIGTTAAPISVKVERQSATISVVLAAGAANIGTINNISATVTVLNLAGTANIGAVSLAAGTSNIGFINNISATVNVAFAGGISLAAGTANIGFINGISATVNVAFAGGISLAAGTANIGFINGISATVNVVNLAGTANIGGVSLVAGTANIGFINGISATVNVAGIVNISNTPSVVVAGFKDNSGNLIQIVDSANTALRIMGFGTLGSLPIGGFLDSSGQNRFVVDSVNLALRINIAAASATVTVVTANPWLINVPSASHGPKTLQLSTSATATLIAAPGAGLHIYVTSLAISNSGTSPTDAFIGWSASIAVVVMSCAANGGGFVMNIDPPWKVQSNEAVLCYLNKNTLGNCYVNVNFFVAA